MQLRIWKRSKLYYNVLVLYEVMDSERTLLESIRNKLPLRPIAKRVDQIGLLNHLFRIDVTTYIMFNGDRYTMSVNDATATFEIKQGPTPKELFRLQTLFGERPIVEDFVDSIKSDDIVYDVGANIGLYSCLSSDIASHVIAVEPNDFWKNHLQRNLSLNDGETSHIDEFLGTGDDETTAGDQLTSEFDVPSPTVLKIDVDGCEAEVLKAFNLSELTSCRLIYVEVHPAIMDYTPNYVEEQLLSADFSLSRIHEREDEFFIRAEKT